MEIPSERKFAEYLVSLSSWPHEWKHELDRANETTEKYIATCLKALDAECERLVQAVVRTEVHAWLSSSPEFMNAVADAFGAGAPPAIWYDHYCRERARPLERRVAEVLSDQERHIAKQETFGFGNSPGDHELNLRGLIFGRGYAAIGEAWCFEVASALASYEHHPGSGARAIEAKREFDAALEELRPVIVKCKGRLDEMKGLGLQWFAIDHCGGPGPEEELLAPAPVPMSYFPLRRADMHADERLFVYRAFSANNATFREPKVASILHLMSMGFFRHQYDSGQVRRMCGSFAKLEKGLRTREREAGRRWAEARRSGIEQ